MMELSTAIVSSPTAAAAALGALSANSSALEEGLRAIEAEAGDDEEVDGSPVVVVVASLFSSFSFSVVRRVLAIVSLVR